MAFAGALVISVSITPAGMQQITKCFLCQTSKHAIRSCAISRDSRKSRQNDKNTANFGENRKNHSKIMAKNRHQITRSKIIIQCIKLNI